jgi:hypothetical protein
VIDVFVGAEGVPDEILQVTRSRDEQDLKLRDT